MKIKNNEIKKKQKAIRKQRKQQKAFWNGQTS